MAIYVIDGYPGHGKTAYAIKWIYQLLKSGERIFSDTKIFPEHMFKKTKMLKLFGAFDIEGNIINKTDRENENKRILYWRNFEDLQYLKQGTVFCDEGIRMFNSRNWERLPEEIQLKLVQHRKESIDLILTTQHYTRLDIIIRQLCEVFIRVRLIYGSPRFEKTLMPRIARVEEYYLEDLDKISRQGNDIIRDKDGKEILKVEPLASELFWIKSKMFKWYDTSALVGLTHRKTKYVSKIDVVDRDTGELIKTTYE